MYSQLSFLEKLLKQLDEIKPWMDILCDNSEVQYYDPNKGSRNSSVVFATMNPYRWTKKDEKTQMVLIELFSKFYQSFELLLYKASPNAAKKIKEAEKDILNLIHQDRPPSSMESAKQKFLTKAQVLENFIKLLCNDVSRLLVIPDTNAVIQYPDPTAYRKISSEPFCFVLLPTVLSELEKHKAFHRDESFRNKAKSVIKRLKGYRNQGNVLDGVIVDKSITVKMIAAEPNFTNTLQWLNAETADDRVIASALELQIQNPSDRVIVITNDINLQNKAQMASLNFADTDALEEDLV